MGQSGSLEGNLKKKKELKGNKTQYIKICEKAKIMLKAIHSTIKEYQKREVSGQ